MNTVMRALTITLSVLRVVPAQVYLTFGAMSAAFIALLAGPSWAPLTDLLSYYCIGYGAWRGFRRQRALHGFMEWKP